MEFFGIDWNEKHILKANTKVVCTSDFEQINTDELKKDVEPWLSAIFQSEHLSLLVGTGLTSAVSPRLFQMFRRASGIEDKNPSVKGVNHSGIYTPHTLSTLHNCARTLY